MKMKRMIFIAVIVFSAVAASAQSPLSFGAYRQFRQQADTTTLQKKWFLTKYVGISTGFFGGGGNFLAAPLGVQINRQLNKNMFAFAGVSAAPTYFRGLFYQPLVTKGSPWMQVNNFGTNMSAHLGLMYINDERTFSISGSIGVSRYNTYSPFYNPRFP